MGEDTASHVRTTVTDHVGWLEFDRGPVNAFDHTPVATLNAEQALEL